MKLYLIKKILFILKYSIVLLNTFYGIKLNLRKIKLNISKATNKSNNYNSLKSYPFNFENDITYKQYQYNTSNDKNHSSNDYTNFINSRSHLLNEVDEINAVYENNHSQSFINNFNNIISNKVDNNKQNNYNKFYNNIYSNLLLEKNIDFNSDKVKSIDNFNLNKFSIPDRIKSMFLTNNSYRIISNIDNKSVEYNQNNYVKNNEYKYYSPINYLLLPVKKLNFIKDLRIGLDESAYLFDWIDAKLELPIASYFDQILHNVKSINKEQAESVYPDIYSIENQLNEYSKLNNALYQNYNRNFHPNDMLSDLTKYNKNIDPQIFINSITISQFVVFSLDCNWSYPNNSENWQKEIFDKYDFDGDGRLNNFEFISLSIYENNIFLGSRESLFTYKSIIDNILDPMFIFADLDNDGKIYAQNLWNTLKELNRGEYSSSYFNIFNCNLEKQNYINRNYNNNNKSSNNFNNLITIDNRFDNIETESLRTQPVNDFILKSNKLHYDDKYDINKGYLDIYEFRLGILLGYAIRIVKDNNIFFGRNSSEQYNRWGNDGLIDYSCEKLRNVKCLKC